MTQIKKTGKLQGLKALVAMQLKDKADFSFLSSFKKCIFKVIFTVLGFVAVTAAFYGAFYICKSFSVFAYASVIPDTVVTILFSIIQILALFSCTVNLTKALYMAEDNRVLFTFPVENDTVFFSKLIIFYIFELKRNLTVTLPLFIAYGIINGAVWYYALWLVPCFLLISLLPVALGALLSIPSLYIFKLVSKQNVIKALLFVVALGAIAFVFFKAVNMIPQNIDINSQWNGITKGIREALESICQMIKPLYLLCLMVVGGTLVISTGLFTGTMLITFGVTVLAVVLLFGLSYLLARPLFFKMASAQFEHEKSSSAKGKNRRYPKSLSPLIESFVMTFRSPERLIEVAVQLLLPMLAVFLLNKLYGAMDTSFVGDRMTRSFSILVILTTLLTSNTSCASILSREGAARNIIKTRPEQPIKTVFARITPCLAIGTLSAIAATFVYSKVSELSLLNVSCIMAITILANAIHVLWSAELDLMNPQSQQYITVGENYSNPNEIKSTIFVFVIPAVLALAAYFLSDRGSNIGIIKATALAVVFFGYRLYMFITRTNLYFEEK